jgi:hypothetical protein
MTVIGGILDDQRRQLLLPLAGGRKVVEIGQQPFLRQVGDGDADVPLDCARRVAARDPVHRRLPRRGAADHGAVDPGAAALLELLGEHADRLGFTAAGPPMDHVDGLCRRRSRSRR